MAAYVGGASKARAQSRAGADTRQVPLILGIGREGRANRPAAADELGARLLATLHRHLSGSCTSLCGDRSPDYFAKALRGERVLAVARDLAQLATRPEREAREAVHDFCGVLLDAIRPNDGTLTGAAVAQLLQEVTEAVGAYSRAMDDGRLTVDEIERLLAELDDVTRATSSLRAVLEGQRRRLSA